MARGKRRARRRADETSKERAAGTVKERVAEASRALDRVTLVLTLVGVCAFAIFTGYLVGQYAIRLVASPLITNERAENPGRASWMTKGRAHGRPPRLRKPRKPRKRHKQCSPHKPHRRRVRRKPRRVRRRRRPHRLHPSLWRLRQLPHRVRRLRVRPLHPPRRARSASKLSPRLRPAGPRSFAFR